jgi:thiol:disulfide interchange protein
MARLAVLLAAITCCALSAPAGAQPFGKDDAPVGKVPGAPPAGGKLPKSFAKLADVTVEVSPLKAKRGETVTVKLTVAPKSEAKSWTYPAFPKDDSQRSRNTVVLPPPGDLVFIGKVEDPPIKWKEKPREGEPLSVDQYTSEPVTWVFTAVVSQQAKPGPKSVLFEGVDLQVCDTRGCVPVSGDQLPPIQFSVEEGAGAGAHVAELLLATEARLLAAVQAELQARLAAAKGPASADRKTAKPIDAYKAELQDIAARIVKPEDTAGAPAGSEKPQTGLWSFVATAALWGLISLVTPCVFPMIPITVSIFLKQAHGSLRERLKLAGVYCATIITVLGVSAFALLKFMAWLSTQPTTNLLLALLFFALALSLFGMYDIALPNSLQKRLQARQAKGGTIGTIFGALAFTVISFTCVAPFLGGFAGISAGSDGGGGNLIALPTFKEIAGGLAFATAFAAPFFVLALVPGLLKALPKSGGWLDSVKVVMGFLELAAALKFLRTAELGIFPTPRYFTYDVVLGGWVAISAACGLYLLNLYRLPHDEEQPNISAPRLLFALLFLGLAVYLAPALFKGPDGKPQRPAGTVYAWVESFLLPDTTGERTDLKETIEAAEKSGKPVFVDFTGVTCTNCKYNESTVFPQPAVKGELDKFEKVQLYTDWLPESAYSADPGKKARTDEALANRKFQVDVFKDVKLPLYAVLVPRGKKLVLIGTYEEGKINDPAQFATFLKESHDKAKALPK